MIEMQTRYGPIGALLEKLMLGPKLGKTVKSVQGEFKAYVEASVSLKRLPNRKPIVALRDSAAEGLVYSG